ncbi:hypothetical protein NHX12_030255, partial [Muraenolepis orangiensis]
EVAQLQDEVQLLRQMKEVLTRDLEEMQEGGCSAALMSDTDLRVQLGDKEQELGRAMEALQAMKGDRKRLKVEKADLVSQMQQLYTTLESREDQLRDFIRNYDQHRKESEDAVKALAKEKDVLEREKWDLRRQTKEATEQANILRSHMDMKENRLKELEAELTMAKQSLATLTKDVPKRQSVPVPTEPLTNGSQEWVTRAELPLTAAIRQSQQTLYHSHTGPDRQAVLRISPCHSRQPSVISDASVADGDRSSTPSDINSPRHRTHSLCNQRKSMEPGLFDGTPTPDYYIEEDADCVAQRRPFLLLLHHSDSLSSLTHQSLSDGEDRMDRLRQAELTRNTPMSLWRAGAVQAWIEVVMAMPMYTRACSENVKSGKVLLELTDDDLKVGLGISNPIHHRKLKLAIADYRRAEGGQGLSNASELDHHWVARSWLGEVGLPQYAQAFQGQLVDGRVLSSLSRGDLEKHLGVSDQFHQTSLLLATQLLQQLNFDKEVLQARRAKCEHQDHDLVVWTCHRVMKWIRDIDLREYADNLQGKGVHGAVMALDSSFDADAMARALGFPHTNHMLQRHLYEEMKLLSVTHSRAEKESEARACGSLSPGSASRCATSRMAMRRSVMSPLRSHPKGHSVDRGPGFHGSSGSLPREARVQAVPRTEESPAHTYKTVEITSV